MEKKPLPRWHRKCVVFDCTNRDSDKSLSFHCLPSNQALREQWLMKINNPNYIYKPSHQICSSHFTSDSFEKTEFLAQFEATRSFGSSTRHRNDLKRNAIPTIFARDGMRESVQPELQNRMESRNSLPSSSNVDYFNVGNASNYGNSQKKRKTTSDVGTHKATRSQHMQTIPLKILGFVKDTKTQTTLTLTKDFECQTEPSVESKSCQTYFPRSKKSEVEFETTTSQEAKKDDEGHNPNPFDVSHKPSELPEKNIKGPRTFNLESKDSMKEKKFLVFESALLQLFQFCFQCLLPCTITTTTWGSMVTVKATCERGHINIWKSQPMLGQKPLGNIIIAASILFSGLNPTQALRMLTFARIQSISRETFLRIQQSYLIQSIRDVWNEEQTSILQSLKKKKLKLVGDANSDSPGFNAKYGKYVFFESQIRKIVHLVLVQSTEIKNSVAAMELVGFKRGLKFLLDSQLKIASIVTDRHVQIRSYLKKFHPKISHLFDCWHMVKSLKKKLHTAATKGYEVLDQWNKSVQNHLYWSVTSSKGKPKLIHAKFMSVLRHVTDIHHGHGKPFTKCIHGDLALDGEKRDFLLPGTPVFEKFKKIIKLFEKDIKHISPDTQTSSVEAYNSILMHFAPKNTHFSYLGMEARMLVAALHYNENSKEIQATAKDGEKRRNIYFPKGKTGEYSVYSIMQASTYDYVEKLFEKLLDKSNVTYEETLNETQANQVVPVPRPLLARKSN